MRITYIVRHNTEDIKSFFSILAISLIRSQMFQQVILNQRAYANSWTLACLPDDNITQGKISTHLKQKPGPL